MIPEKIKTQEVIAMMAPAHHLDTILGCGKGRKNPKRAMQSQSWEDIG